MISEKNPLYFNLKKTGILLLWRFFGEIDFVQILQITLVDHFNSFYDG